MNNRQCPFCGQIIPDDSISCYNCREMMPDRAGGRGRDPAAGYLEMRRGILYVALGGVIHYFASGLGGYELPVEVPAVLTDYLLPFLMLGGAGLFLYGIILKIRG